MRKQKLVKIILFIIFFLCISNYLISTKTQIPLMINPQDKVFESISMEIESSLPKNVEILIYQLNLLNGSEELQKRINKNFNEIILALHEIHNYKILFQQDIKQKYPRETKDIDLSFIKKQDEIELVALGKLLNQDAIMVTTVTIMNQKTPKKWDNFQKKWLRKSIGLIQCNIYNTDSGTPIHRFAYYFYY